MLQKEELRKKQQEKRLKLAAEERRLKELQKAAMEEVEEENRKALAHEMHKKEMELTSDPIAHCARTTETTTVSKLQKRNIA